MIHSTTELLSEITSVQGTVDTISALAKPSQISAYSQKQRKEFTLRYVCMQAWFIRCSWLEKLNTLTQLIQGLKTIDSLGLILNTLINSCSKTIVYAECQYTTNFVYDKKLKDHNRCLCSGAFKKTKKADIEWFKSLEEDYEQVLVVIGLIRLGGGSLVHHVFEKGKKVYNTRIQEIEKTKKSDGLIEIKISAHRETISEYNLKMWPDNKLETNLTKRQTQVAPRILNIIPTNLIETQKPDPNDPFTNEVEKLRKAWNEKIKKYRIQVEGKPNTLKKGKTKSNTKANKKGKKDGKNPKATKGGKNTKEKKGKKGKKRKIGNEEALDYIQLLPIWIVKKIFNYLDIKTLKKVKTVNKYWAYAINDLQKEQKARKYLDKFISKMEETKIADKEKTDVTEKSPILKSFVTLSTPKQRLMKLWQRGAVLPKLRVNLKKPIVNKSLTTDAATQVPENYLLPMHLLESFPRNVSEEGLSLYKKPSWIANELGFIKIKYEKPIVIASDNDVKSIASVEKKDYLNSLKKGGNDSSSNKSTTSSSGVSEKSK